MQSACAELHLPLKRFGFVGALFDHIPFAQRGFDAISLIAVGRASRLVHTPADASDQLHVRGFDQAGRVALHVIEQMIKCGRSLPAPPGQWARASLAPTEE